VALKFPDTTDERLLTQVLTDARWKHTEFVAPQHLGAYGPLERVELICAIEGFIEGGWDGKFQTSPSWADEYGWPDKNVDEFFRSCIREAVTNLRAVSWRGGRPRRARQHAALRGIPPEEKT